MTCLKTPLQVRTYLLNLLPSYKLDIGEIQLCMGGKVNWVWRIHFTSTEVKKNFLYCIKPSTISYKSNIVDSLNSVILKFYDSTISCNEAWTFSTERLLFEINALLFLNTDDDCLRPPQLPIVIPTLYYSNLLDHVMLIEDLGKDCLDMQEWFIQHASQLSGINYEIPSDIGRDLGAFIAKLHRLDYVDKKNNDAASQFLKRIIYDEVENWTLLLPDPTLPVIADMRLAIEASQRVFDTLYGKKETRNCFIMGDLWPKALLFLPTLNMKLGIIDWEFSGQGNKFVDISSFLFWCWILFIHYSRMNETIILAESYRRMARSFILEYRKSHSICIEDLYLLIQQFGVLCLLEAVTSDQWCIPKNHTDNPQDPLNDKSFVICPCKTELIKDGIAFLAHPEKQSHLLTFIQG